MKAINERTLIISFLIPILLVIFSSCANNDDSNNENNTVSRENSSPQNGGDATALLVAGFAGSWPTGIDPATNVTGASNLSIMNAIFGGLFQLTADDNGENPRITGVLASGYELADDGQTFIIHLRDNVIFSDGTPFNAEAIRFNILRNLESDCPCSPTRWPWDQANPLTVLDEYTIALHFSRPFLGVMNAITISNINWPASPTAIREMSEDDFKLKPVGAGPFTVVSNQLSSKIVLKRNTSYWQKGRPFLDTLTFQSVGNEQAAFLALRAGDAHAVEGITSTQLIKQAMENNSIVVTQQPANSPYVIQLNTKITPFNDPRARQAIYYATNTEAILKGLFNDWYSVSQSFTGPGGLFHHEEIPGYRKYDLEKAKSIVNELGELQITLGTLQSFVSEQVITALQSQWQEAGFKVSIETYEIATLVQEFQSGEWQSMLQTAGSYDPEAGPGVNFRFRSGQLFSGIDDQELDLILNEAAAGLDPQQRDELYFKAGKYISDNAYAPFLFAFAATNFTTRNIHGPGLTTKIPPIAINTGILWQDVWIETN